MVKLEGSKDLLPIDKGYVGQGLKPAWRTDHLVSGTIHGAVLYSLV